MRDYAQDIVAKVTKEAKRADVVPYYAEAIMWESFARPPQAKTDWKAVNLRIMRRWSPAGLTWIKRHAWEHAKRTASALALGKG